MIAHERNLVRLQQFNVLLKMSQISLPLHLILPTIISAVCLGLLYINRTRLANTAKRPWLWISLAIFLFSYCLLLAIVTYMDISADLTLQSFDLNEDGSFSQHERTPAQKEAKRKVVTDTSRNFSFVTGFIYAAIITLSVSAFRKAYQFITSQFKEWRF